MLELVVSDSEKGLLRDTKLFNDEDIVSFSLLLSYGKIKDLKCAIVREICGYTIDVQDELKLLRENVSDKNDIRIWYSSSDNEDVCTLCFVVNYLSDIKNLNIYVCDASDSEHFSLGSFLVSEVDGLIKRTKKLSDSDKNFYMGLWDKLENENGDLRIIDGDNLISYGYNYLDNKIIELLEKYDNIYYWSFVGECMSLRLCNFYGDIFFTERINKMIEDGKIIVSKIVTEKNFMGEFVDRKYIKVI